MKRIWRIAAIVLVLATFASACSSEPNLIVGQAADAADKAAEANGAVADDSAPVEVGALNAAERPFLNYIEESTTDQQLGDARFVLVDDDGEPLDIGTAPFERFSFSVSLYEGVSSPVVMTLGFGNWTVDADGQLASGICGSPFGQLSQRSPTEYLFLSDTFPKVKHLDFAWSGVGGCDPDQPPIEPAGIFAGAFDIEFGDEELTVIDSDGNRWQFAQVPYRLARWGDPDAPITTVVETTTTTIYVPTTTTTSPD